MHRRDFFAASAMAMGGAAGLAGASTTGKAAYRHPGRLRASSSGKSMLSFIRSTDTREAAYNALKPLQQEVEKAIGDRQVVLKVNCGVPTPEHRHECTDVEQIRGILDFLKPIYDRPVIICEGAATIACSVFPGYEAFGYMPLEKEYNVKLVDANDQPTTTMWIYGGHPMPAPINIINTYLDPNNYVISACRLKTSGSVIVTLSMKNNIMGSPVCHYKRNKTGRPNRNVNEKVKMHGGRGNVRGKDISFNMFNIANLGVYPDLSVLDGVVAAEGNGPWNATPIEHGVALASTDCIAADRVGAELMGVDYKELRMLQWCARAGIGASSLSKVTFIGENYRPHAKKYKLNKSVDRQREWLYEPGNTESSG